MFRTSWAVFLLLAAYAVLDASAPKDGWEPPIDPDHDCKLDIKDGTVAIELPGGVHDLNPYRKRFNAPRLLREVEGDFVVQVRVSGSFRPSAKSSMDGEDSCVAAGLIVIPADKDYIRLEYEGRWPNEERLRKQEQKAEQLRMKMIPLKQEQRQEEKLPRKEEQRLKEEQARKEEQRSRAEPGSGPVFMTMGKGFLKMGLEPHRKLDRHGKEEQFYLRFERQGNGICEAISPDGKTWNSVVRLAGSQDPPPKPKSGPCAETALSIQSDNFPRRIKVGLAAYSTSKEPFKVRFDQFKLTLGGEKSK